MGCALLGAASRVGEGVEALITLCLLETDYGRSRSRTRIKQRQFPDYYRANWQADDDPDACVTPARLGMASPVVWSRNRQALYETASSIKDYDYYLFLDGDVVFEAEDPLTQLLRCLDHWKPLSAHVACRGVWSFSDVPRRATCISCFDQCVFVLHRSLASLCFPLPVHGAFSAMWFAQWFVCQLYPRKQIVVPELSAVNTEHGTNHEALCRTSERCLPKWELIAEWNRYARPPYDILSWSRPDEIRRRNKERLALAPDRTEVGISLADVNRMYDIDASGFAASRLAK